MNLVAKASFRDSWRDGGHEAMANHASATLTKSAGPERIHSFAVDSSEAPMIVDRIAANDSSNGVGHSHQGFADDPDQKALLSTLPTSLLSNDAQVSLEARRHGMYAVRLRPLSPGHIPSPETGVKPSSRAAAADLTASEVVSSPELLSGSPALLRRDARVALQRLPMRVDRGLEQSTPASALSGSNSSRSSSSSGSGSAVALAGQPPTNVLQSRRGSQNRGGSVVLGDSDVSATSASCTPANGGLVRLPTSVGCVTRSDTADGAVYITPAERVVLASCLHAEAISDGSSQDSSGRAIAQLLPGKDGRQAVVSVTVGHVVTSRFAVFVALFGLHMSVRGCRDEASAPRCLNGV